MAEELKTCQGCGATVYPEHISSGKAGYWQGKLYCPICMEEAKSSTTSAAAEEEEPIQLIDEEEMSGESKIKSLAAEKTSVFDESKLKRPLNKTGMGATRLRIFHSKMSDGAIDFMVKTINEWIDSNEDIEIKMVQSHVGVWEGKHAEPHLILTVWY